MPRPHALTPTGFLRPLILAICCGLPIQASAQPASTPFTPQLLPPVTASPAQALAAFSTIRSLLDRWSLAAPLSPQQTASIPAAYGASVQLRSSARLIGRGTRWSAQVGSPTPDCVIAAARDAYAEADARLPIDNDALRPEKAAAIGQQMTLSLELAGPLRDLLPPPQSLDDLDRLLAPGLDGLAIRQTGGGGAGAGGGAVTIEAIFPGAMLALNQSPSQAALGLIGRITGDPSIGLAPFKDIIAKHGLTFSAFRVTHLAQPKGPLTPPDFLTRGARTVPLNAMASAADVKRFADELAEYLQSRVPVRGELSGLRTYQPNTDDWIGPATAEEADAAAAPGAPKAQAKPTTAVQRSAALAALALAEYQSICPDARKRAGAFDAAGRLLQLVDPAPPAPKSPDLDASVTLALAALASAAHARIPDQPAQISAQYATLADQFLRTLASRGVFQARKPDPGADALPNPSPRLDSVAGVLAAASLIEYQRTGRTLPTGLGVGGNDSPRTLVTSAFIRTPPSQLVAQMPFLAWAALAAGKPVGTDLPADDNVSAIPALRAMRADIRDHQLSFRDATDDQQDLIGGISFTAASTPLPTWSTARVLAALAPMLADDRYTSAAEAPAETLRLLMGMRFLRQLQVDDANSWMYANPGVAKGGIRAALWDQSMPVDATSSALIAAAEAIRALEAPRKQQPAAAPR